MARKLTVARNANTKSVISGTLAVNDDLTQHVNEETIDNIFGDGVARSYEEDPNAISDKFLK